VSFGDVDTGSSSTRSVTVTNAGAAEVSVSNVSISGAGFSATGVPAGLTLAPGDTADLAVTFAPSSAGKVTGSVAIAGEPVSGPVAIALSGTGVASGAHSVTLTWNASTSSVAGYRAYRATSPAGPYSALNSTPNPLLRWTDSTVQSGATYYYVVTAVAADTTESAYSDQASAAIPKP
jgi:Abnormal spindle-like microcephaly-assoc'd, ASPM-SPD-2-Hydin